MKPVSERAVLFVIGAVQFVNILEFMIVMPMGPDFGAALDIPNSHIGYIGGAYTAAAGLSGLVGSLFLDRFDRKRALIVAMIGLVLGTASVALAWDMASLLAARVIAGAFGGPATSLAISIVADVVPPERRGRAMGAVMSAFSVASVLGVPAGLLLALVSWRFPFLVVAGMGVGIIVMASRVLPPMRGHIEAAAKAPPVRTVDLFRRPVVLLAWLSTAVVMMAGFVVIPNISAYVQENIHFPRVMVSLLYLVGGVVSFFSTRGGGVLADRIGSFAAAGIAAVATEVGLYVAFVNVPGTLPDLDLELTEWLRAVPWTSWAPVVFVFAWFMAANSLRNVSFRTLTSKVPAVGERARFMSIDSSVQHFASSAGAFLSSRMLVERADKSLAGMDRVALVSMALTALIPGLLWVVERRVNRPDVPASAAQPHDPQSGLTGGGPGLPRPRPPA